MANAVVDLPDPLQSQPVKRAGETADGADDLLSAMVGDEIDRLLAEADARPTTRPPELAGSGTGPAAEPEPPKAFDTSSLNEKPLPGARSTDDASAPTMAQELDDILSSVDSLIEKIDDSTDEPVDEKAAGEVDPSDAVAKDADDDQADAAVLDKEPFVRTNNAAAAVAEPAFQIDDAGVGNPDAIETPHDVAGEAAELPPLEISSHTEPSGSPAAVAEIEPVSVDSRFANSPLVRVLQWINRPFDACPVTLRDALGKAGVATLVNAAAILLYVRWIHQHH